MPGRETQALELFEEATEYYKEKVDEKVLTYFEPFFFMTSDHQEEVGFFILKGPAQRCSSSWRRRSTAGS